MNSQYPQEFLKLDSLARRRFLRQVALGCTTFFTVKGAFAEALQQTPRQTEGPFYPDKLPLDTDNDLLILNDSATPALGEITHFTGRVLNAKGDPINNVTVEIWQCDEQGSYLHTDGANGRNKDKRDKNFQGYGRFLTSSRGEYDFRTIKPVSYPGRTPHIHFIIKKGDKHLLTTQCYIKGHPANQKDGLLRRLGSDPKVIQSVMVDWKPIKKSKTGEFAAHWDIVIGQTAEDPKDDPFQARRFKA